MTIDNYYSDKFMGSSQTPVKEQPIHVGYTFDGHDFEFSTPTKNNKKKFIAAQDLNSVKKLLDFQNFFVKGSSSSSMAG